MTLLFDTSLFTCCSRTCILSTSKCPIAVNIYFEVYIYKTTLGALSACTRMTAPRGNYYVAGALTEKFGPFAPPGRDIKSKKKTNTHVSHTKKQQLQRCWSRRKAAAKARLTFKWHIRYSNG